jgi:Icc protein
VLAGNHDDPDSLRERFGPAGEPGEPLRYAAPCGDLRLVVCCTRIPGSDAGELGADGLAWLESQLAAEPGAATVVAMHHPPVQIGLPVLDAIGLPEAEREALADLLARSSQVRRVVAGHVHRAAFAMLGGCPVVTCPSTHIHPRLEIGAEELNMVPEPPAFAVHAVVDGDLVSHIQPIFDSAG